MSGSAGRWAPPTRRRVFGEFWWRSLALATAGGGVIGLLVGPLFIIEWGGSDTTVAAAVAAVPLGAFFGAVFGFLLGMLAGVAIGTVGAIWLHPYRGPAATKGTLRASALVSVGLWSLVFRDLATPILGAILIPSFIGAWWISPWVGSWYLRWMSEAPGPAPQSGTNPH